MPHVVGDRVRATVSAEGVVAGQLGTVRRDHWDNLGVEFDDDPGTVWLAFADEAGQIRSWLDHVELVEPHYVTFTQHVGGNEATIYLCAPQRVEINLPEWSGRMDYQEAAAALDELETFVRRSRELLLCQSQPPRRPCRWPAGLHTRWGMHKRGRKSFRYMHLAPVKLNMDPAGRLLALALENPNLADKALSVDVRPSGTVFVTVDGRRDGYPTLQSAESFLLPQARNGGAE